MAREREMDFFKTARDAGTRFATTETDSDRQLEQLVLNLTTLHNDFFNGIDRSMIYVVMSDTAYSRLRSTLNREMHRPNVDTAAENFVEHIGVKIFSSTYLPYDVDMVAMVKGAIAHPSLVIPYSVRQNPYSDAKLLRTSYVLTATAVMPDAIFWKGV
ncbi:MAG: hypothetical protein FWG64_02030 [Firmicutes bacterium]|nr:hypothetical protein [Bacillota bacterium]